MTEDLKTLAETIKDIKITMFTTVADEGHLYSRPMATLELEPQSFDGRLYFFTDRHSAKVSSVNSDHHVNLAYSEPSKQRYVSVCGQASLIDDRALMEKLWSPFMKAWFPEGLEDPNIALLCVEVDSAEIWNSPPSKVVQLVGLAKSLATGERFKGEKYQQHIDVRGH